MTKTILLLATIFFALLGTNTAAHAQGCPPDPFYCYSIQLSSSSVQGGVDSTTATANISPPADSVGAHAAFNFAEAGHTNCNGPDQFNNTGVPICDRSVIDYTSPVANGPYLFPSGATSSLPTQLFLGVVSQPTVVTLNAIDACIYVLECYGVLTSQTISVAPSQITLQIMEQSVTSGNSIHIHAHMNPPPIHNWGLAVHTSDPAVVTGGNGVMILPGTGDGDAVFPTAGVSKPTAVTVTIGMPTPTGDLAASQDVVVNVAPADLGDCCETPDASVGAPINVANGNTYIRQKDFEYHLPVGFSLGVDRIWNSLWPAAQPFAQHGLFGDSWMTMFDQNLQFLSNGDVVNYWRADGSAWTFQWDPVNLRYNLKTPQDAHATLTYDPPSNTYSINFKNGDQFQFSSTGQLLIMYDKLLYNLFLVYDDHDKLLYAQDPLGKNMHFQYGNSNFPNLVTAITTDAGPAYQYSYDFNGRLTQVVYPDASQVNYQYDANGLVLNVTDVDGKLIEAHTYDNQRRGLTSVRAGGVEQVTITYSQTGSAQVTNSAGLSTTYAHGFAGGHQKVFSASGLGCSSCNAAPNVSKSFDSNGNLLLAQDSWTATTFGYDSQGNTTFVSRWLSNTNPLTWTYTYDQNSNLLTATDPAGNTTTNTYNSFNQLVTTTAPSPGSGQPASTTTFTYDYAANSYTQLLTGVMDPLGHQHQFTYDSTYDSNGNFTGYSGGLITSVTDSAGHVTSYEYDVRNNRTSIVDALGNRTQFSYDVMNRLTGITWPDQTTASFTYDHRGRRASATDPNGKTTSYGYDDADRLISVTDPANNSTQYAYDTENNLTTITDALGRITRFQYDNQRRVTATIFPSGLSESYTYDGVGNLASKTDRNGNKITYFYDHLNRRTVKRYLDSTAVGYSYDLAGRASQVSDSSGTYSFAYDNMGRLTGTTTTYSILPGVSFTNSYDYDAASNLISLTLPNGTTDAYQYDVLNRLTKITDSVGGQFTLGYDALGRRANLGRPNGVNTSYAYDSLSRLLSVLHQNGTTTMDGATYAYDNAGNRTAKTNLLNNITEQYTYDALYELTQVGQGTTTSESYSYDAVGNRLSSIGMPS